VVRRADGVVVVVVVVAVAVVVAARIMLRMSEGEKHGKSVQILNVNVGRGCPTTTWVSFRFNQKSYDKAPLTKQPAVSTRGGCAPVSYDILDRPSTIDT
jgi:hypothetical protein